MKLRLEKLTLEPKYSFVLQQDVLPYYPTPWHYHPEYELVLVVKSTGQRIVGDWIENFSDGDLVFMGPNLPHVYTNDPAYYEGNPDLLAEAIVVHFREDSFGRNFFSLPEMILVNKLFDQSKFGLKILGETRQRVAGMMHDMLGRSGHQRLIWLLTILEILSLSDDLLPLASPGFVQQPNTSGTDRITRVYEYIMTNFRRGISLTSVAEIASMSPPSFCRFFKACTRKSFSHFLNEVRIGYACKLLLEDKLNISQICYESGYNNISNFNRQFRKITGTSPLHYKKEKYR
jgi:AraC-like DNA-binding protein